MMHRWVVGVDGGGSKTRALVADMDGEVRGEGVTGPSNHHAVGEAISRRAIVEAIDRALEAAGASGAGERPRVRAASLGLAGLNTPADLEAAGRWAAGAGIAERVRVVHDSELVLAAGTPDNEGIALISGTGSVCVGRSRDGRKARAGGWGWVLGDEGSGFDIGWHAVRLATQTADGRAAADRVLDVVLRAWDAGDPHGLIERGHAFGPELRSQVARLARPILELGDAGDPGAQALLDHAAVALVELVRTVERRLQIRRPPLAMAGGILRASPFLRARIGELTKAFIGETTLVDDPARGALAIALELR